MKIGYLIFIVAVAAWRWFCALEARDGNEPKPRSKSGSDTNGDDRSPLN